MTTSNIDLNRLRVKAQALAEQIGDKLAVKSVDHLTEAIELRWQADSERPPLPAEICAYVWWTRATDNESILGRSGRMKPIRPVSTYRSTKGSVRLVQRERSRWSIVEIGTDFVIFNKTSRGAAIEAIEAEWPDGDWTHVLTFRDATRILDRWEEACPQINVT